MFKDVQQQQLQQMPFNSTAYYSNKKMRMSINHMLKIGILSLPVLTQQYVQVLSPIGRNIVIPQRNRFGERKTVNNCQSFGQWNSYYYQPQPDTYSSYYQPQPDKYNPRQQYCQDRLTQ